MLLLVSCAVSRVHPTVVLPQLPGQVVPLSRRGRAVNFRGAGRRECQQHIVKAARVLHIHGDIPDLMINCCSALIR